MGVEIEAKMRLNDLPALTKALNELGGERQIEFLETNTYFDNTRGTLKSTDQGLRIRIEQHADSSTRVTITHKGPRAHGKLKSRAETEVGVDDARDAADLLAVLGYAPVLTFEKRRCRWQLDGCSIELDTLPYLGDYVEIEGETDEAVLAVREKLGLSEAPLIKASYIAMLLTYAREHNLHDNVITFDKAEAQTTA